MSEDKALGLLTMREAAKMLRIQLSTLRAWRLRRILPFVKLSGRLLVRQADLEAFIAASVTPAACDQHAGGVAAQRDRSAGSGGALKEKDEKQ